MTVQLSAFRVKLEQSAVADLRERLSRTRWPDKETVSDWSQGVPLAYVQELCAYWANGYDFSAAEARLNAFPQFRTEIDGLGIHYLHVRSPHSDALPLILTHGWPGSVVEFQSVIDALTRPADPVDAFHVIIPSLPGYGFSDKPRSTGCGVTSVADIWAALMAQLGYDRYGAQGGDWGSLVTQVLAQNHPGHLAGIHLNMAYAPADGFAPEERTAQEEAIFAAQVHYARWEGGYSILQATRPQTLGYGLADSPAAQCAWIIEKFYAWSDCSGSLENAFSKDQMLDNVMLYWLSSSGASSARLYWESYHAPPSGPITVPTGISVFPKEIVRLSKRWAQKRFTDLRWFNELAKGGHFAAFEQPEAFVDELRSFFRLVR